VANLQGVLTNEALIHRIRQQVFKQRRVRMHERVAVKPCRSPTALPRHAVNASHIRHQQLDGRLVAQDHLRL